MPKDSISFFPSQLLAWHHPDDRPLPWKNIKDPYLIWLSEIILQQTRAVQAIPYFNNFSKSYPTVAHLAKAPIDDVLAMWQGLGYYSRARNLHHSAQQIMDEFGGVFPDNYEDIISLKGVGKYTAAAIASFAFGLPYPVVDGNVIRIISRYFDIELPVDKADGLNHINRLVQEVFDKKKPAKFNQAIMDFGATVCRPKNPDCDHCKLQNFCLAKHNNTQALRPVKSKKLLRKIRHFNFLFIKRGKQIYIQKRTSKDIWQGLYQLPLVEGEVYAKRTKLKNELNKNWSNNIALNPIFTHKQLLTHQVIHSIVWQLETKKNKKEMPLENGQWVSLDKLSEYGFPKSLTLFFTDNSLY